MALLGAQIVITLIMVTLIQKIGAHYSFSRWMICSTGLIRYLYPTDTELRSLAGVPKEKWKGKKDKKHNDNGKIEKQTFHVPKNLEFELESAPVTLQDVVFLRYYWEYQWILDFALYSLMVYTVSEIYTYYMPLRDEINLSLVWCILVILCAYKLLFALTVQYFKGEESMGERSLIIVSWFGYLLLAMGLLIVDDSVLETGLETAYKSFNESAHAFLHQQGVNTQGPASKLILKFFLAIWCATLGALFTFPGLRSARCHWDAIKLCRERKVMSALLNISFAAPFICVALWLRPVAKHYLTVRVFSGMFEPLLSVDEFDSLRLVIVTIAVLQRLAFMPTYLQAYLNIAYSRVIEQKKEAGRITNVDLQKKIAVVFYYMCVVALQYIIPLIICLFSLFMYKTLGDYSWSEFILGGSGVASDECPIDGGPQGSPTVEQSVITDETFSLALSSLKQLATKDVMRGLFGFSAWWTLFVWFSSSSLGLVYQSYFTQV